LPILASKCRSTALVKFVVISDTHGLDFNEENRASLALPAADIILHCGDLTNGGALKGYEKAIAWLLSIDAELGLVIAGNHDLSLDEAYVMRKAKDSHD